MDLDDVVINTEGLVGEIHRLLFRLGAARLIRVSGFGFRVSGLGFTWCSTPDPGFGVRVPNFWVSGFTFQV